MVTVLYENKEDWMLKYRLITKKGGTRGRKPQKRPAEPSTVQGKRRRQQNETTTTTAAIMNVHEPNSGRMSCDNDRSDSSLDSSFMLQVTRQVMV